MLQPLQGLEQRLERAARQRLVGAVDLVLLEGAQALRLVVMLIVLAVLLPIIQLNQLVK